VKNHEQAPRRGGRVEEAPWMAKVLAYLGLDAIHFVWFSRWAVNPMGSQIFYAPTEMPTFIRGACQSLHVHTVARRVSGPDLSGGFTLLLQRGCSPRRWGSSWQLVRPAFQTQFILRFVAHPLLGCKINFILSLQCRRARQQRLQNYHKDGGGNEDDQSEWGTGCGWRPPNGW